MQRLCFGLALSLLAACAAPAATLDATAPDVASEDAATDRVPSLDRPPTADTAAAPDVAVDRPSADAGDAMTVAPDVLLADASADAPGDAPTDVTGTTPPDFMLPDLNPASRTHRMTIVPSAQRGVLSVWYFASAT